MEHKVFQITDKNYYEKNPIIKIRDLRKLTIGEKKRILKVIKYLDSMRPYDEDKYFNYIKKVATIITDNLSIGQAAEILRSCSE